MGGVAKPLSLFVETYGTEQGDLTADDITNIIKVEFDCRPGAIAMSLALREPKYQETAAYCHFGREPYTKDGVKFFEWENAKEVLSLAMRDSKRGLTGEADDEISDVLLYKMGDVVPTKTNNLSKFPKKHIVEWLSSMGFPSEA